MKSPRPAIYSHRAKLQRADQHLQELKRRISSDFDAGRFGLIPKPNLQTLENEISVRLPDQLRIDYGLIVGDVVGNLRAALDHLTHTLIWERQHTRTTAFPIFHDHSEYTNKGLSMIRGVTPDAQAVIERLQPYNAGDVAAIERHPLASLSRLSNWDKHHLINFAEVQILGERTVSRDHAADDFTGIFEGYNTTGPLIDQTVIRHFPMANTNVKMQYQFALGITLGETAGPAAGERVAPILENLIHTVEGIIETLEPFIPA